MFYTLQLNAKLQPFDRHDLEDLIDEFLSEENLGNTSGGGTLMSKEGEITTKIRRDRNSQRL